MVKCLNKDEQNREYFIIIIGRTINISNVCNLGSVTFIENCGKWCHKIQDTGVFCISFPGGAIYKSCQKI